MQGSCFLPLLLVASLWLHTADSAGTSCPKSFSVSSGSNTKRSYSLCTSLPELNATLSLTYHPGNGSVDLAFRAKPGSPEGWVAWGINPSGGKMFGTQALIAIRDSNGTIACNTYNVSSTTVVPSPISFSATNLSSEYDNGLMTIFATVLLPSNKTTVKQVWQVGSKATGLDPSRHAMLTANLNSYGYIDLATGKTTSTSPTSSPSPSPSPSPTSSPSPSSPSPPSPSSATMARISVTTLLFLLGFSVTMFYNI